jgi:hypothetical protein
MKDEEDMTKRERRARRFGQSDPVPTPRLRIKIEEDAAMTLAIWNE